MVDRGTVCRFPLRQKHHHLPVSAIWLPMHLVTHSHLQPRNIKLKLPEVNSPWILRECFMLIEKCISWDPARNVTHFYVQSIHTVYATCLVATQQPTWLPHWLSQCVRVALLFNDGLNGNGRDTGSSGRPKRSRWRPLDKPAAATGTGNIRRNSCSSSL